MVTNNWLYLKKINIALSISILPKMAVKISNTQNIIKYCYYNSLQMTYSTKEEQLIASILRDDFLEQRRNRARKLQKPRTAIAAHTSEVLSPTAKAVSVVIKMSDTNSDGVG